MNSTGESLIFDRNLYFGVLAIRQGYIRTESFFAATNAWMSRRSTSIGQFLMERDLLSPEEFATLEKIIEDDLQRTGRDALLALFERSGPLAMTFELALQGFRDADIDASLQRLRSFRADGSTQAVNRPEPLVSDFSKTSKIIRDQEIEPDISDDEIPIPRFPYLDPPDTPETLGMLGPYRVIRLIGEGAYGTVFHGFDIRLHRNVAIKVLKPGVGDSAPPRRRFIREARAGAQVDHPNVVRVFDVAEKPLPHLIMEYFQSHTLHDRIQASGRLPLNEVIEYSRQLAEGLAAAHDARLVHRDIKPGNILVAPGAAPTIKITDFGLVRVTYEACISESDEIHGTPLYMSPEQARGRSTITHLSDLFSLGSVMYAMTTGQAPFQAANTLAILRKVIAERPRPIKEFAPDAPEWLVDLVGRLMSKRRTERAQRVGSARNVARYLQRKRIELDSGEMPAPSEIIHDPLLTDSTDEGDSTVR